LSWGSIHDKWILTLGGNSEREASARGSAKTKQLLKPIKALHKNGSSTTKPGTLLKHQIPVKTEQWDVLQPGFFEPDTVAHCCNSIACYFVKGLTFAENDRLDENRRCGDKAHRGYCAG
jgi:hypothetical protein